MKNQMKNDMKKLPLSQKMAKIVDMKKVQQQVATLRTQQQKRTDMVVELQEEEKILI